MRGQLWLQEQGLLEGCDYQVVHAPNEDSLARWLSSGDAPLALMSGGEFNQLNQARCQLLEVVAPFATVPGFLLMVPMQTSVDEIARLQAAGQQQGQLRQALSAQALSDSLAHLRWQLLQISTLAVLGSGPWWCWAAAG